MSAQLRGTWPCSAWPGHSWCRILCQVSGRVSGPPCSVKISLRAKMHFCCFPQGWPCRGCLGESLVPQQGSGKQPLPAFPYCPHLLLPLPAPQGSCTAPGSGVLALHRKHLLSSQSSFLPTSSRQLFSRKEGKTPTFMEHLTHTSHSASFFSPKYISLIQFFPGDL